MSKPVAEDPKVVKLPSARSQSSSVLDDYPLVDDVNRHLQEYLMPLFNTLFNEADDILFNMADKATSGDMQNRYFDAMRVIRMRRNDLVKAFFKQHRRNLHELMGTEDDDDDDEPQTSLKGLSLDSLSLVNEEQMEEAVALEGQIKKAVDKAAAEWSYFHTRIRHLTNKHELKQQDNPLGPHKLCDAFLTGLKGLDLDLKVVLIIFKLFDKYIGAELFGYYQEANDFLIEEGVLPDLQDEERRKRTSSSGGPVRKSADKTSPGSSASKGSSGQSDMSNADMFNMMRELLSQTAANGMVLGQGGSQVAYNPNNLPAVETKSLVKSLSGLQNQVPDAEEVTLLDIKRLVTGLSQQGAGLGQVNGDAINLVAMLFEFILDDHQLAPQMKQLLARLQIPIIKVALMDRDFFSKGEHPARVLLNELARAATGWDEKMGDEDPLLQTIEGIVFKLLKEFENDINVFNQQLDLLHEKLAEFDQEQQSKAQELIQIEETRVKVNTARLKAGRFLKRLLAQMPIPTSVSPLLTRGWYQVLMRIYYKQGKRGTHWEQACRVAKELCWCLQPGVAKKYNERYESIAPALSQHLRKGLEAVHFTDPNLETWLSELDRLVEQLRPKPDAPTKREVVEELVKARESVENIIEEIQEPKPITPAEETDALPNDDPALLKVDEFSAGLWFDKVDDRGEPVRCKLAAIIRTSDKYIFVNRNGQKIAESTRMGLAKELKSGILKLLDESMLFDRALQAVIGNLRGHSTPS